MPLTLHLLRHAVHGHPQNMLCGRMEGVCLAAEGQRQAARLATRFKLGTLDALYASPVQRCRETAEVLGETCGLRALIDPAVAEVDFGEWTGRRFAELAEDPRWQAWNLDRDHAAAPNGETMADVQARVLARLDEMIALHPHGRVAVVTHAEIVRTAVLHVLGLPLQAYDRMEVGPASITTLCLWSGGGRLTGLNDASHIADQAPVKEVETA